MSDFAHWFPTLALSWILVTACSAEAIRCFCVGNKTWIEDGPSEYTPQSPHMDLRLILMYEYKQIMTVAFQLALLTLHDFFAVHTDCSKVKLDNSLGWYLVLKCLFFTE